MACEFGTIGVCDGIAMGHVGMKYSLPSRDLIADSIEIVAQAHALDGLVLVVNCDKIVPGMLMAAARLDIPSVLVSGGPDARRAASTAASVGLEAVFEAVGRHSAGEMTDADLARLECCACPGPGSCAGLFTANTMNCLSEALGLALPGNGTIPAVSADRPILAREAGRAAVRAVRDGLTPRKILTRAAFLNAVALDMALGGSTNTALHLPAIAASAGVPLSLDDFDAHERAGPAPLLARPVGPVLHAAPARRRRRHGGAEGARGPGQDRRQRAHRHRQRPLAQSYAAAPEPGRDVHRACRRSPTTRRAASPCSRATSPRRAAS